MVKLHLFSGFEKQSLGITADMALGHLYDDGNSLLRLAQATAEIGVGRRRAQISKTGLVHYALWGAPLSRAKRLFPIVSSRELGTDLRRLTLTVSPATTAVTGPGHGHGSPGRRSGSSSSPHRTRGF